MSSICESLWGSGVGKIYVVPHSVTRGFPAGSVVKNPPVKQETWVRSLGQEDPLEKEMATHSSVLAWRISWTEEPGGVQSMGLQSRTRRGTHTRMHYVTKGRLCVLGTPPYIALSSSCHTCEVAESICIQISQCGRRAGDADRTSPEATALGSLLLATWGSIGLLLQVVQMLFSVSFMRQKWSGNTDSNDCWVPFSLWWSLIPKFLHLLTVLLCLYMLIRGQRTEMPWNININKPHLVIAEQIKHMIHSRLLEPFVLIISHFQTPLAPFHIVTSKYPGENCYGKRYTSEAIVSSVS